LLLMICWVILYCGWQQFVCVISNFLLECTLISSCLGGSCVQLIAN
jgi:hypothetical protein